MNNSKLNKAKTEWIEKALNSAEEIQKVEPKPFLFTRIQGRMQKGSDGAWLKDHFIKSIGITLAFLLVLNIGLLLQEFSTSNQEMYYEQVANFYSSEVEFTLYETENY